MRLQNFEDRFLYVVKYLDKDISKYLAESEEAINFYYRVEEKSTGIKISFAIIYIIVVSVLLFVSISIAIRFSSRFFRSINNLISASTSMLEIAFDLRHAPTSITARKTWREMLNVRLCRQTARRVPRTASRTTS